MARARNIKPGFFKNEILSQLSCHARLLFIGLWTIADREGRLEDRPLRIRGELFPYESVDIDSMLYQLESNGFIIRYSAQNRQYISVVNFSKHQTPHVKEQASTIQAPGMHQTCTEVAHLIPSSLIPDSPFPITSNGVVPDKHQTSPVQAQDFEPEKHFQEFMNRHPGVKTRIGACRSQFMGIVIDSPDPVATVRNMKLYQDQWISYWNENPTPPPLGLLAFLADGDCLTAPPKPPKGASIFDD
jgi:hypothetical protein